MRYVFDPFRGRVLEELMNPKLLIKRWMFTYTYLISLEIKIRHAKFSEILKHTIILL